MSDCVCACVVQCCAAIGDGAVPAGADDALVGDETGDDDDNGLVTLRTDRRVIQVLVCLWHFV